jgi:hypothetical protein
MARLHGTEHYIESILVLVNLIYFALGPVIVLKEATVPENILKFREITNNKERIVQVLKWLRCIFSEEEMPCSIPHEDSGSFYRDSSKLMIFYGVKLINFIKVKYFPESRLSSYTSSDDGRIISEQMYGVWQELSVILASESVQTDNAPLTQKFNDIRADIAHRLKGSSR